MEQVFRAKDGHFGILLQLNRVFKFVRTEGIISISTDGLSEPTIYMTGKTQLVHAIVTYLT